MMSLPGRPNAAIATTAIATLIAGAGIGGQQPRRFDERVNVDRIIVDARVLDNRGDPVLGLTAGDFKVRIDRKVARVESAAWIGEHDSGDNLALMASSRLAEDVPPMGRLVVFLFQKDLESGRIVGLMRMLLRSRSFLDTLTASDRVAILSFDSHLKIWTDFTNDRERLDRVLAHGVLFEKPATVQASSAPSLVERLDPARGRRTYGIERALELIAEALEPLPGSKSLVLIGYGFGRLGPSGVTMENDYEAAHWALVAARTSVFSLDVTNADYHSLEAGLQIVSEETGGFYTQTHLFPAQAMRRLSGALAGYYVLFVEKPDSLRTTHDVEVTLTRHTGRVLASSSYSDRNE
jgi:VWFA-related protein